MKDIYTVKVYSRDGKFTGKTTGGSRSCTMESCRGVKLGVRWSDGKLTFPCTHGMTFYRHGFRIL